MAERASAVRRRVAVWTGGEWAYIVDDWPYLPLSGGTLSGLLEAHAGLDVEGGFASHGTPTQWAAAGSVVHKEDYNQFVLDGTTLIVEDGGAVLLKSNTIRLFNEDGQTPYTPTQHDHPATKQYADKMLRHDGSTAVSGTGLKYNGASIAGSPNSIGFRWYSPNIYGVVDNTVSAVVGVVSTGAMKTAMTAIPSPLQTLGRLEAVEYEALDIDGSRASGARHLGLVAEQVAQVLPDAVVRDGEGAPLSVNYFEIIPLLVAALQEAVGRIAVLEGAASG